MEVDFSYPLQTSIAEWYPKKPAESVRHKISLKCVLKGNQKLFLSLSYYIRQYFLYCANDGKLKLLHFFFKKIDSDYETDYETDYEKDPPTSPSPYPSPYPNIEPNQSRQQYTLHRNRRDIIRHIERGAAQYVTEQ